MTGNVAFAPFRSARFSWYFASRFTTAVGSTMATIALTFAVLDITDSASALGQVLAAHTVPMVVLLLYGGVIADRMPRTLVIQGSNVVSALAQGAIAWLVLAGHAHLWQLVVLSVLHGSASAISLPAVASMLPQLVPHDLLQPANALMSISRNALTVLGPTIGALLVVTVGPGWALAVDALTWIVGAALLMPVRLPPRTASGPAPNTVRELKEGWRFFISTTWLWVVVVAFALLNAMDFGAWLTLGPVVAQDTVGRQGWGYALSAEAAGLLLASVVLLRLPLRRPVRAGMLGITLVAAPILILGLHPQLGFLVAAAFIGGVGIEVMIIGWNLAMQEHIDESMLARASSYDMLGSVVAMPIGQLAYGPLGEWFGYQRVLVVTAVAHVAVALSTLLSRSVRTLPRSGRRSSADPV